MSLFVSLLFVLLTFTLTVRSPGATELPMKISGTLVNVVAAVLASMLAILVFAPGDPLAQGSLKVGGPPLSFTAPTWPVRLVVHGELPPLAGKGAAVARYTLKAKGAGLDETRLQGRLEERYVRKRVTRRTTGKVLMVHQEHAHDLAAPDRGGRIEVRATEIEGLPDHTIHVAVMRGPPGETWLVIAALVLALLGALTDVAGETHFAMGAAISGAFAVLLPVSARHDSPWQTALVVAVIAGAIGGAVGWTFRALARRTLGRLWASKPGTAEPSAARSA